MADLFPTSKAPSIITTASRSLTTALDEIDEVTECVRASDKMKQDFVPMWDEVLQNFLVTPVGVGRGRRPGIGWPAPNYHNDRSRSVLKDPESHQIVQSLLGQLLSLLLQGKEYVTAIPVGADDPGKARLISRLIMALLEQSGVRLVHQQAIMDALLFGTSYIEIGWETRSRMQVQKIPNFDAITGEQNGWRFEPREVLWRDRPLHREPDLYDIFPDPSGTSIQEDMQWIVKRFRLTKEQARELARPSIPGEPALFDASAVERAIARSALAGDARSKAGYGTSIAGDIASPQRKWEEIATEPPDRFGQITGFEKWGFSTVNRRGSIDTSSNRRIAVWGGEVVASTINPFIDGNMPFKELRVNPISGRHYGLAPLEVVRFLQDANDALLMAFVDAVNAAVAGPLLVGQSFLGNIEQLKRRKLLDLIECRDVKAVAPVPVDYNAISLAASALAQNRLRMREASGTNLLPPTKDTVGDRPTATQFNEVVRVATQHAELLAQPVETDTYPWIGRTLHSRIRQFMPEGGAEFTLAGELFNITLEDIDVDADIRFVGSRSAQTRSVRINALARGMEVLQQNQGVVLGAPYMAVRLLQEMEIPDAERIVNDYRTFLVASLQQAAVQGGPQAQGSPPASSPVAAEGPASA